MSTTPNAIIPGSQVRHPSRGTGIVETIVYDFRNGRVLAVWAEFPVRSWTQRFKCRPEDLTPMPPPVVPALRVVDGAAS